MIYFSNIIIPMALLMPNILFMKFKPTNVPRKKADQNKSKRLFEVFERIGQAGIYIMPLFYKMNISNTESGIYLLIMGALLLIYYGCWIRYFVKHRDFRMLFERLWMIPLPMAIIPILYMIVASKVLNSHLLLIATLIFSVGHLPLSYMHYKSTLNVKMNSEWKQ